MTGTTKDLINYRFKRAKETLEVPKPTEPSAAL